MVSLWSASPESVIGLNKAPLSFGIHGLFQFGKNLSLFEPSSSVFLKQLYAHGSKQFNWASLLNEFWLLIQVIMSLFWWI